MGFPSVASIATTADTSSASVTVNMPSGIVAGDLLLVFWAEDVNGTVTQSGGSDWTDIDQGAGSGSACRGGIWAKIAAGSDTLTLTSTNSQDFSCVAVRITGHGVTSVTADIFKGTAATGSDAAPQPPNCNPGTAGDYLWLETFAADDDDDTTTYESSGYSQVAQIQSANSTSSCLCAVASRQLNASAEDPGAMALAATEEWRAQTIAIKPSATQNYTLTLAFGSFAHTGQAAGLVAARQLSGAAGSFVESGQAAGLVAARQLPMSFGSLSHTGQDATLRHGYLVALDAGTFALAGQAAALVAARQLPLTFGSFVLTGISAGTLFAHFLDVFAGSFALTGQAAGVLAGKNVGAGAGLFSLSGQALTLVATHQLVHSAGVFALAGQAAALMHGFVAPLASGGFELIGPPVNLLATRVAALLHGLFALSGQPVTFVLSGDELFAVTVLPDATGTVVVMSVTSGTVTVLPHATTSVTVLD